jgi:hypothetical protein
MTKLHTRWTPFVALAALCLLSPAFGQPPPIRIMPLGDSITYGSSTPAAPGGYRLPLYVALTNLGYNVDYVGTQTGNSAPGLGAEVNHEGHGGWRITNPLNGLYEYIHGWFEAIEDPHVILLHIGTNDSSGFNANTNDVNNLDRLITRLAECQPSAQIIVTSLMKRSEPNYTYITNFFNPYVPGKVSGQQAVGRHVTFLDMHAYLELSDMNDNLHPNATGYAKMAEAWLPSITNVIGTNVVANQPAPIRGKGTTANREQADITFNKSVSADSATNLANYAIDNGLSVSAATLSGDQRTVTLATSLQAPDTVYTVTMSGIEDETVPAALTIPANSEVTFTSPAPPVVVSATGLSNDMQVDLLFSKSISATGATNTSNYSLSGGLSVLSASLSGDHKTVTLTTSQQQPATNYTVTINNVEDESVPLALAIAPDSQVSFTAYKEPIPRGYWNYVPESAYYSLVYSLDLASTPNYSNTVPYSVDNTATVGGFDRVAYYLELQKSGEDLQYVWVSMEAFTNRADKLGIPNLPSGALYQQYVNDLHIECNVPGVATGTVATGNIEFWPWNYSTGNAKSIPGASEATYDFGDLCSFSANYSCMQVHNYLAGQTVFALNHWNSGGTLEAGIGNNPNASATSSGGQRDWTFTNNGGVYTIKTLQVLVRRDFSDTTPPLPLSAWADTSRRTVFVTFSEPLNASSVTATRFALDNGVGVLAARLLPDLTTVALTTTLQPLNTALTLAVADVRDRSPNANAVPPGTTLAVGAPSLPPEIVSNVGTNAGDLAAGYEVVYTLDIPVTGRLNGTPDPYRFNVSDTVCPFDRVAYYVELVKVNGTTQFLWASMDAFTADRKKIGVPTAASGAVWQREVGNLAVKSNVEGVSNDTFSAGGNLEFWASNYSETNTAAVSGASNSTFDFGDSGGTASSGHGCMQIHNYVAGQTLFAMNNWGADGNTLALGIGNRPTSHPDWTHAANAGTDYTRRTLHVLVRPTPYALPAEVAANVPDAAGYQLAYTINLPVTGDFWGNSPAYYLVNNTTNGLAPSFSRIAYYLELQSGSNPTQWVWTAMDAFTTDALKIGVPITNCAFQTKVTRLDVRSNADGIVTGSNIGTGNIEFWPSNYGGGNSLPIPNAHNVNFDFGDGGFNSTTRGYGSMQVHNHGTGATQTLFAVNNFNNNNTLCIGIGNCPNPVLNSSAYGVDWTFKSNAGTYNHRRLHVFVLPSAATADLTRPTLLNARGSLSLNEVAIGFSEPLSDTAASTANFSINNGVTVTAARLSPGRRDVILTTSPLNVGQIHTVTVTGVADASSSGNLIIPGSTATFWAPSPWPADVLTNVAESAEYELIAYLAVSNTTYYAKGAQYVFDESKFQRVQPFDRVAYCMELTGTNGVTQWVYVSMDAFTNDLSMVGVPTADRADPWIQQYVSNLNVYAYASDGNVAVTTGVGIAAGNIEFWSSNYGSGNARSIPGASGSLYDFGDDRGSNRGAGHGSMQVHNYLQGHTIFSMISFGSDNRTPGLGIGNNPVWSNNDPDWTFTYNARTYSTKNIYVLARRGLPTGTAGTRPDLWNQPRSLTVRVGEAARFSVYSPNATAYQWRSNGTGIPGATQSWLEIDPAHLDDGGTYDVLVYGSGTTYVLSQEAELRVYAVGTLIQLK